MRFFWLLPVIRPSATAQDMASFAQEDTFGAVFVSAQIRPPAHIPALILRIAVQHHGELFPCQFSGGVEVAAAGAGDNTLPAPRTRRRNSISPPGTSAKDTPPSAAGLPAVRWRIVTSMARSAALLGENLVEETPLMS